LFLEQIPAADPLETVKVWRAIEADGDEKFRSFSFGFDWDVSRKTQMYKYVACVIPLSGGGWFSLKEIRNVAVAVRVREAECGAEVADWNAGGG
jgi:hypothetical protein